MNDYLATPNNEKFTMEGINAGILPVNEDVDATKDQIRTFMVAQARRELQRIIKLTDALDIMENKFINAAAGYLELYNDPETGVTIIPQIMETLSKSLARSNDLVAKITNNKELMNFTINNNINVGDSGTGADGYSDIDLTDSVSRERVRNVISSILSSPEFLDEKNNDEENK